MREITEDNFDDSLGYDGLLTEEEEQTKVKAIQEFIRKANENRTPEDKRKTDELAEKFKKEDEENN